MSAQRFSGDVFRKISKARSRTGASRPLSLFRMHIACAAGNVHPNRRSILCPNMFFTANRISHTRFFRPPIQRSFYFAKYPRADSASPNAADLTSPFSKVPFPALRAMGLQKNAHRDKNAARRFSARGVGKRQAAKEKRLRAMPHLPIFPPHAIYILLRTPQH